MGPTLEQLLNIVTTTSLASSSLLAGFAVVNCLWSIFVGVVIFRASLWLWDWLSLAEARNWQTWHPGLTRPGPVEIARHSKAKWRAILIAAYILAMMLVAGLGLFIVGQPYAGGALIAFFALFTIGMIVYAVVG